MLRVEFDIDDISVLISIICVDISMFWLCFLLRLKKFNPEPLEYC